MCAYVAFSVYNKIQSSLDIENTILAEQIELDTEENTEEEIDFEDQFKTLTMQSAELFIVTDQKYKCCKNVRQFSISSYLEYDTPPPKLSC
jgi:hypothetical protein